MYAYINITFYLKCLCNNMQNVYEKQKAWWREASNWHYLEEYVNLSQVPLTLISTQLNATRITSCKFLFKIL